MTFEVWAGGTVRRMIASAADLDALLDHLGGVRGDDGAALIVTILPVVAGADIDEIPGLEVAVGHPERAIVHWTAVTGLGSGYAIEPGVPPWPDVIGFDYNGQCYEYEPLQTAVTAATARRAALQYATTSQRPTCLRWPPR